ncbi:site-2 protease family protein [Patescibacteria group bacterium]|nr:site-2 protease family protein [Patescibacteria group bacterium]
MIALTIFALIILLFSVIIHEIAHGFIALLLGDTTAKREGRLTLNPIKHLDPIGSIAVPLLLLLVNSGIIFGWAKPVPVNPYNFKDQKYGQAKVALAGPAVNFLIAIIFGIIIRFIPEQANLFYQNLITTFGFIVWINLLLGIFNLIPIPPLDGSHILFTFLPDSSQKIKIFFSRYGLFFLLFFIFYLFPLIIPIISFLFKLITGISFY